MATDQAFRILVIEDDPDAQKNLRDILQLDGYHPVMVSTAAETLRRSDWPMYSAIILDWTLPDGTAETLLPELRRRCPQAAVVVVTGTVGLDGTIAAIRHDVVDYFIKPPDIEGLRATLRRIQERQHLAAEKARSEERVLQAERLAAIAQAMDGLIHEGRNSLQRSQACLEMLAMKLEADPEAVELLARMQLGQHRLHQLYERVRQYASPLQLDRRTDHLGQILRNAWDGVIGQPMTRVARLTQNDSDFDLHAEVDSTAIRETFEVILENTLAAVADPVEVDAVWSETLLDGIPALQVAIRDNGPGFSAESRAKAFQPFNSTKTRGLGLGLAIARRVVEAHGGTIALGTGERPGGEVLLNLPRKADHRPGKCRSKAL